MKNKSKKCLVLIFLIFATYCGLKAQDGNNKSKSGSTVTDIDGNVYHTVTIGTQVWMVENLKTTTYRNGVGISKYYYYDYNDNKSLGEKFGKLYTWHVVNDNQNIAPIGWHVPTDDEWTKLLTYIRTRSLSLILHTSHSVGKDLAGQTDWNLSTDINGIGNDLSKNNFSGFTALPGGNYHMESNGKITFSGIGEEGNYWSSNENGKYFGSMWLISYDSSLVLKYRKSKGDNGCSVRCIKD